MNHATQTHASPSSGGAAMLGAVAYRLLPGSCVDSSSPVNHYRQLRDNRDDSTRPARTLEVYAMSDRYHALVWIDHREAKVFHFNTTDVDRATVRSSHPDRHIHHKANSGDSGHAPVDNAFFKEVTQAIGPAEAMLIAGPANAKTELVSYIKRANPLLARRISGVETLDHPSDGALVALARSFFKADDRLHAQSHR
jgi:hypothetical protein